MLVRMNFEKAGTAGFGNGRRTGGQRLAQALDDFRGMSPGVFYR